MSSDPLGAGLREELITRALDELLTTIDRRRVERRELETAEVRPFLTKHVAALTAEWLATSGDADNGALVNRLAEHLGPELLQRYGLRPPPELLTGIRPEARGLAVPALPDRPQIPLTANELLVNDRKQPSIGSQLKAELQSTTHVDLICAFVIWSGVVTLLDELRDVIARGGEIRVITTPIRERPRQRRSRRCSISARMYASRLTHNARSSTPRLGSSTARTG